MSNLTDIILDRVTGDDMDFMRVEADVQRNALRRLRQLERDLIAQLARVDPSEPKGQKAQMARLDKLLAATRFDIRTAYLEVERLASEQLVGLARLTIDQTADAVNGSVSVSIQRAGGLSAAEVGDVAFFTRAVPQETVTATVDALTVQGAPARDWWRGQARNTQAQYIRAIRTGLNAGENLTQLRQRIIGPSGIMKTSQRNADAMIQTSIQSVINESRMDLYRQHPDLMRGIEWRSVLDNRTSPICIALSGQAWTIDGVRLLGTTEPFPGPPPAHWRCRSTIVPVFRSQAVLSRDFARLKNKFDQLPSSSLAGIDGQLSQGLTFEGWLRGQSEQVQRQKLGPKRLQLWKDGQIALTDLIDQRARPRNIEQLEALIQRRKDAA